LPDRSIREFADTTADPPVRGFLHSPATPNRNGLVLTHGAGGNAQAPLLRALAEIFSSTGYTVLRSNLPYRQVRSFGPPGRGDAARDRAGLKNAIAALKNILGEKPGAPLPADFPASGDPQSRGSENVFLAGHSYGGRQSSILCAEEPGLVAGLLLLSYPLHPIGRPGQQRTEHLPDLDTPTLFVHGTRDPFGSIEELERAIQLIPAKTKLLTAEGAGHDLGFKPKRNSEELPKRIYSEFLMFFEWSSAAKPGADTFVR
jgi:predicted alpha/beta-hydrolase family hydrolase